MCKVSVIMCSYNTNFDYFREAINSILNQTFKDFELIIVIDGPCDEIEVAREFKDSRIKIIQNEKNMGLAASLNVGIENSCGEFICEMDSDDIAEIDRLETEYKYMVENPDISICSMFAKSFGKEERTIVTVLHEPEDVKCQLLYATTLIHPSVMIRREFLTKNKLAYNPYFRYSQDFDLWSRCAMFGKISVIPKFGLRWRVHDKQVSTAKRLEQDNYYKEIVGNNLKSYLPKMNNDASISYLMMLNNKIDITNDNYIGLSDFIEELIEYNKEINVYDKKALKRNLYYRYFTLIVKNNLLKKNIMTVIKNKNLRRKVFNLDNISIYMKRKKILSSLK